MQMVDTCPQKVLNLLRKTYTLPKPSAEEENSFETLIITTMPQNTTDKNTVEVFQKLSSKFKIDPETLANSNTREVEECLRIGGLFRQKAKAIKQSSRTPIQKWEDTMTSILSLPIEDTRKELMRTRLSGETHSSKARSSLLHSHTWRFHVLLAGDKWR